MTELLLNSLGVAFLWFAIEYCLRHQTARSLDEASLIPFADDPEAVSYTHLTLPTKKMAPPARRTMKPGWLACSASTKE